MGNESVLTPQQIAELGEKIYKEKLKKELEPTLTGKFLAIEVISGEYFVGDTILEALEKGRKKYSGRLFHTIRIGYEGVFKMGSCARSLSYGWKS